jgi:hypothetical protein
MSKESWDQVYRIHKLDEIPWHSSQPDGNLVKLIQKKNKMFLVACFLCGPKRRNCDINNVNFP